MYLAHSVKIKSADIPKHIVDCYLLFQIFIIYKYEKIFYDFIRIVLIINILKIILYLLHLYQIVERKNGVGHRW